MCGVLTDIKMRVLPQAKLLAQGPDEVDDGEALSEPKGTEPKKAAAGAGKKQGKKKQQAGKASDVGNFLDDVETGCICSPHTA